MRIVVAHSRLNTLGGGERCVLELLKGLSARHDVLLWAGAYDPEHTYPELAGFPRVDVAPYRWLAGKAPAADAVITNSFGSHLLALRHPRAVCYLHTLRSVYLRRAGRPDLLVRRALDNAAITHAFAVATSGAYTADRAAARYRRRVDIIPPGVDSSFFAMPPHVGGYALYVGRLAPEKGVERLLTWSAALDLDLRMAGEGAADYVAHLRALAGPRVRFLGGLTGGALLNTYNQARFVVFLPHEEEFGLSALEAMAAGKPVVASREGGLAELVAADTTGLFVASADEFRHAVQRLLADDTLCMRLGERGRVKAQAYTWDRFTSGIERLCQSASSAKP